LRYRCKTFNHPKSTPHHRPIPRNHRHIERAFEFGNRFGERLRLDPRESVAERTHRRDAGRADRVQRAFSVILFYAQEPMSGRAGMVSGLFFGFAFGLSGIGAATLGWMADNFGIAALYQLCAWFPLLGIVAVFLPQRAAAVDSPQDRR
jgi:hypothetical protein